MEQKTNQMDIWSGAFGEQYTDRNPQTVEEVEKLYIDSYGFSRIAMNRLFLSGVDTSSRILEVGCNVGSQLLCLQTMGFSNLYGIEVQQYAVELAKQRTKGINIIQGSALEIPFRDGFFDLVFTSGVLIHISPETLPIVMGEMYRCSSNFIWGFEYFAEKHTEVPYRGNNKLLWKGDFSEIFLNHFPSLERVRECRYKYLSNDNVDKMYLLNKKVTI